MLGVASCDENANVLSGSDTDSGMDGPDGGPLLGSPMKPTLNFTGIGIDYDPEARCSDDDWSTDTPVACSPQLSFTCPSGDGLALCPERCQKCYNDDMSTIKSGLSVDTITIYQPNYYILTAAQSEDVNVMLGLFNDTVAGLASRHCSNNASMVCVSDSDCGTGNTCMDDQSGCTFAGSPSLCGAAYADSILDGACYTTTPWDPNTFCEAAGAYITPNGTFISDGTVIAIQLGNEVLSSSNPPLTKQQVVNAAQVLRNALDDPSRSLPDIPIVVSLVAGNEQEFCEDGAPPTGVDYIAAHPYCNFVASVPPMWPFESMNTPSEAATDCWNQVLTIFQDNAQMYCGAGNTFIGETGYNTGCPMSSGEATHLAVAPLFIDQAVTWGCQQDLGTFLFAFVDACPPGGCEAGCSSSTTQAGNGYFGLYYTEGYLTKGTLNAKYNPLPTLTCQ